MDTSSPQHAESVVRSFWHAAETRDWPAFAATLAPDVVYTLPQTRERVRGRDAVTRFNQEYPGDWHLSVTRLVGRERHAVSEVEVVLGGESVTGIAFFDLGPDGLVGAIEDWWPEPYEAPAGRAHLVERW